MYAMVSSENNHMMELVQYRKRLSGHPRFNGDIHLFFFFNDHRLCPVKKFLIEKLT